MYRDHFHEYQHPSLPQVHVYHAPTNLTYNPLKQKQVASSTHERHHDLVPLSALKMNQAIDAKKQYLELKPMFDNLKISLNNEKHSKLKLSNDFENSKIQWSNERQDLTDIISSQTKEIYALREELSRYKLESRTWQAEKENYLNQNKLYERRINDLQLEVIAIRQGKAVPAKPEDYSPTKPLPTMNFSAEDLKSRSTPTLAVQQPSPQISDTKLLSPTEKKQQMIKQHISETKKSTTSYLHEKTSQFQRPQLAEPLPRQNTFERAASPDPSEISVSSFNTAVTHLHGTPHLHSTPHLRNRAHLQQGRSNFSTNEIMSQKLQERSNSPTKNVLSRKFSNERESTHQKSDSLTQNLLTVADLDFELSESIDENSELGSRNLKANSHNKSRSLSNQKSPMLAPYSQNRGQSHSANRSTTQPKSNLSKISSQENVLSDTNSRKDEESSKPLPQLAQKLLFGSKKDAKNSQVDSCDTDKEAILRHKNSPSRTPATQHRPQKSRYDGESNRSRASDHESIKADQIKYPSNTRPKTDKLPAKQIHVPTISQPARPSSAMQLSHSKRTKSTGNREEMISESGFLTNEDKQPPRPVSSISNKAPTSAPVPFKTVASSQPATNAVRKNLNAQVQPKQECKTVNVTRSRTMARMRAELRANSYDMDGETTCDEDGTPLPLRKAFGFRSHGPPVRKGGKLEPQTYLLDII